MSYFLSLHTSYSQSSSCSSLSLFSSTYFAVFSHVILLTALISSKTFKMLNPLTSFTCVVLFNYDKKKKGEPNNNNRKKNRKRHAKIASDFTIAKKKGREYLEKNFHFYNSTLESNKILNGIKIVEKKKRKRRKTDDCISKTANIHFHYISSRKYRNNNNNNKIQLSQIKIF